MRALSIQVQPSRTSGLDIDELTSAFAAIAAMKLLFSIMSSIAGRIKAILQLHLRDSRCGRVVAGD